MGDYCLFSLSSVCNSSKPSTRTSVWHTAVSSDLTAGWAAVGQRDCDLPRFPVDRLRVWPIPWRNSLTASATLAGCSSKTMALSWIFIQVHLLGWRRPLNTTVPSTWGLWSPVMFNTGIFSVLAAPNIGLPLAAISLVNPRSFLAI